MKIMMRNNNNDNNNNNKPRNSIVTIDKTKKVPSVFVVKPRLHDHGGTFGEYKMFTGLLWALGELGVAHGLIQTEAEAAAARRSGRLAADTVVVSDQYSPDKLVQAVQRSEGRQGLDELWRRALGEGDIGQRPRSLELPPCKAHAHSVSWAAGVEF